MIQSLGKKMPLHMLPVLFSLAWPTMLEQLLQTAVQYIDTAMVGALGTDATAAVGSTGTVGWLVIGSISALGIGFWLMWPMRAVREIGKQSLGSLHRRWC